jgi:transcriptional regulator with XRE-family HTH domain
MRRAPPNPPLTFSPEMAFAERLVELRKQHGLTQQALADRTDIHVTLIRRYEAGKTQPSLDPLKRIAIALSVSADTLLFEDEERGPSDDLRLQFEAANRLDPDEKHLIRELIESVLLKHDAKRWVHST